MRKMTAFTLIEMLVVISIIAVLVGILLPALSAARKSARRAESNTHVSSLYRGLYRFGEGNRGMMAGVTTDLNTGAVIPSPPPLRAPGRYGTQPFARLAILIEGNFIDPHNAISPFDKNAQSYQPSDLNPPIEQKHLSYAMLKLVIGYNQQTTLGLGSGRLAAWSTESYPKALLISDRNVGDNSTISGNQAHVSSIHTEYNKGRWAGTVCWGDGTVDFSTSPAHNTFYPGGDRRAVGDNIFNDDTASYGLPRGGSDAIMVFQDWTTGYRQGY